jgi:photosystem II cytochrome c550
MLKRFFWVAVATIFLTFELFVSQASALELDADVRTVTVNEAGDTTTLSIKQAERGKRLFNDTCSQCHSGGRTKTNPNINLSLDTLNGAEPPRDNIAALVDYMKHPTSYDGELNLEEYHPNTTRSDLYPEMRNLTEDDLFDIAGHMLIEPKIFEAWGGGKAYF